MLGLLSAEGEVEGGMRSEAIVPGGVLATIKADLQSTLPALDIAYNTYRHIQTGRQRDRPINTQTQTDTDRHRHLSLIHI